MAKIKKSTGPIRGFAIAVKVYSKGGGLLTICCSRVGANSRGRLFRRGGGQFEDYGTCSNGLSTNSFNNLMSSWE